MEKEYAVYRRMPRQTFIAMEGMPFIAICLLAAAMSWLVGLPYTTIVMVLLAGFVAYFFRNPVRAVPKTSGIIVAPADGRILSITGNVPAPHTGRPSTKVSIFMSVLNVHINRFPVGARVKKAIYCAGRFVVASLDKASEHNERNVLVLEDDAGREYVLVQIAGLVARRIICYVKEGDYLPMGKRFGLIRFGSRVDLYLPSDAAIEIKVGQRTRAGETIVGRLA